MMLVTFAAQSGNTVTTPMLPLFLKSLVNTVSGPVYVGSYTGIVLGVGAAFTALAAIVVGKYAARLGYWQTLIFCLCAAAVFTVPQTFVTNMHQLTILRAFSCFFFGGAMPVINAIIAITADKKHQGTAYGINASVSSAGNALGPMIGSAAAMLSYRAIFLVSAFIFSFSAWEAARRRKKSIQVS
jgi:DHA1 family multidrug resistance protein-like MFS transporter